MTPDDWQRVKAIVAEAWDQPPAARAAFVAQACGDDDAIRREVLSLVESIEHVGDRFEAPAFEWSGVGSLQTILDRGDLDGSALTGMVGRRIGSYEIRRELGRGGMGTVYLATRADQEFTQEVALKIIKRGMDTDAIVRRFRTERQILAGLNHPHIARLLDGGSTPEGLPYLVMEYVEGHPVTAYCDAHRLNIVERLQLFRDVCAAVAYAHQNLIVHRDIKPSNVLVRADRQPKLLDFGLATILQPGSGGEERAETVYGWTPEFASPEQVRGGRVTTASDIYSLGVLLYELLCGRRPFGRHGSGAADWLRRTSGEPPERPSVALLGRGAAASDHTAADVELTAAEIVAARSTSVVGLQRTLRGDLDNIVLKALSIDASRRYPVAHELSEDIRCYLSHLPVSARRDTFAYHATRFIRRHTAAAIAAAFVAATLVVATVVTTAQARIARRERQHADRRFKDVRQLANSFLFDFNDAIETLPGATSAREMVVKTAQEYLDSLAQEAGDDHELLSELSTSYLKLADVQGRPSASRTGDTDAALHSYERALTLRRRLAALEPLNTEFEHSLAVALVRMGPILQVRGDPKGAVERTREGMQITDRLVERAPSADVRRSAFRAPLYLGDALSDLGDHDGALAMYEKALAAAESARLDPPEADFRHRVAVIRERLGIMFTVKGDYQRALESYREALANEEAMVALEPNNADYTRLVANGHYHIGDALKGLKRYSEALAAENRALAIYESRARADPRDAGSKKDIGGCTLEIAETLLAAGNHDGARNLLHRTVAIHRELADADKGSVEYQDDLASSLMLLGESVLAAHDAGRAIARFDEARAIREPIVASRPHQAVYERGLAELYVDLGDAHAQRAAHSSGHQLDEWRSAQHWYQKALGLWQDLGRGHMLWASEMTRAAEVSERLARCDRALRAP